MPCLHTTWERLRRLGGFTQDEFRQAVINMPSKQFGPLAPTKRKSLAKNPADLYTAIPHSYPHQIGNWIRMAKLQIKHQERRVALDAGEELKSKYDQLKTDHNQVFEIQLHHAMAGSRSPLGQKDDMKRYLVLIEADNSDADAVMKGLQRNIKFSMVKGSMNFGLNMFEGDTDHTSADELGKMMEWLAVNKEERHPCGGVSGLPAGPHGDGRRNTGSHVLQRRHRVLHLVQAIQIQQELR
jgi:hypothetical protein